MQAPELAPKTAAGGPPLWQELQQGQKQGQKQGQGQGEVERVISARRGTMSQPSAEPAPPPWYLDVADSRSGSPSVPTGSPLPEGLSSHSSAMLRPVVSTAYQQALAEEFQLDEVTGTYMRVPPPPHPPPAPSIAEDRPSGAAAGAAPFARASLKAGLSVSLSAGQVSEVSRHCWLPYWRGSCCAAHACCVLPAGAACPGP